MLADDAPSIFSIYFFLISINFFFGKKGVRINEKLKNPRRARVRAETQTCGTDSPSRSKSRALSTTSLHPPKKDGSMTDFQHTQSDPHGGHRKMLHVLLTHLPPRGPLTFFVAPAGQAVKRLRTPPSKVLKEQR